MKKKVIIAISGGVDSSVSAFLLKKSGYYVECIFMKNWEEDDNEYFCNSKNDLEDAQKVCDILKIKLSVLNLSHEYWNNVFIPSIEGYKANNTPNPDILCNKYIKFGSFLEYCTKNLDFDYIATGHYAKIFKSKNNNYFLKKPLDKKKDQTYFLYTLNTYQLSKTIFPLNNLLKETVRKIAKENNLPNFSKKDSTGICFIGKRKFKDFIKKFIPKKPGNIITINEEKIGEHEGIYYYTIGQRKGLGIGGNKNFNYSPWYVLKKNITNNTITVVQNKKLLFSYNIYINNPYISLCTKKIKKIICKSKIRYQQDEVSCILEKIKENNYVVTFKKPIKSVTCGQHIVFYKNDFCIGGSII